jgi:hypothetical protein
LPSDHPAVAGLNLDAIERDYTGDELSVEAICLAHGISMGQLYRHVSEQGWPMRQIRRRAVKVPRPRDLTSRMAIALDQKMAEFETRLTVSRRDATAADSERDARTLSTLLRLFERLSKLRNQAATRSKTAAGSSSRAAQMKDTDAPDPFRGELARRLERLRGQIGG